MTKKKISLNKLIKWLREDLIMKEVDKRKMERIVRFTVRKVVESVPVEEEKVKDWFSDYIGYNRHVEEVKEWKKKWLEEEV